MTRALVATSIAVAAVLANTSKAGSGEAPATGCEAMPGQTPICSFHNPEDLVPLPGNQALLVSEYGSHGSDGKSSGIALYTLATNERRSLFVGGDAREAATPGWGDPTCPGPPSNEYSPHGIDLAARPDGALALATVQHGGRESIELFEVTGKGSDWQVEWRGCWIPPDYAWLNEVILLSDGSVMASHMMERSEASGYDNPSGSPGFLLHWTPDAGFQRVAGTEIRFANGFELSPDEKTIYLNSSMGDGMRRIDRATGSVTGQTKLAGALDNTTWAPDGALLAAHIDLTGDFEALAKCDGLTSGACPIPFQIIAVDPETMESSVRFDSTGSPMGAGTVGLQVGNELFIGSFSADRILRVDLSKSSSTP